MKYALIGCPVEHSLSPAMHEAGYKALGLDAVYHRISVTLTELEEGVEFLRLSGYDGWNITYPLKEEVIPFLDSLTPEAQAIGAVNTVKAVQGSLLGHNTDGEGFIESLRTKGYDLRGKKVVILGAGGAAKAVAVALAQYDTELLILNRSEQKAIQLAARVTSLGGKASGGSLMTGDWLGSVDLAIQTTPVGMQGEECPLDLKGIRPSAWVIDLIYEPPATPFLSRAADLGCRTMNGSEMLLYQGVLAWKFWLDIDAPVAAMRRALERISR